MLAIWSTYNESNHCIYHIEDNDYLQAESHMGHGFVITV